MAYLDAIKQSELHKVRQDSYENIRRLAAGDSLRFVIGEITEVDAMQSRLEVDIRRPTPPHWSNWNAMSEYGILNSK